MKGLNLYISEKLKINKDSKISLSRSMLTMITDIVRLCDAPEDADTEYVEKNQNTALIKTLINWIGKDIDDIKGICPMVNKDIIRKTNTEKYFKYLDDFHHDPDKVDKLIDDLIINSEGNEVLTGKCNDPKIYYDDNTFIYHDYIEKVGNIDRVFTKLIF